MTSAIDRRGLLGEFSSRCSLPPAELYGMLTPAPQDVVQFGFAHLQILNLHPGVAPPHRHGEQGCRQGSKLLHSWFESCSNTCGIVGQNLFG